MSKITPKNLHYDTTLPPFLARLQAQNTNQDGRQDFHAQRAKKPRDEEADREDEPVYFDEASAETLTKGEWEEREKFEGGGEVVDGGDDDGKKESGGGMDEAEDQRRKQVEKDKLAASIGGARKRKAGKVVGGAVEDGGEQGPAKKAMVMKETSLSTKDGGKKSGKASKSTKGKKVKLSFGDEEDG